jgi:hypothetical protein
VVLCGGGGKKQFLSLSVFDLKYMVYYQGMTTFMWFSSVASQYPCIKQITFNETSEYSISV